MTWLDIAEDDPFGVQTLPYGVIVHGDLSEPAVRIGEWALALRAATELLQPELAGYFPGSTLDEFLASGPPVWAAVRTAIRSWLTEDGYRAEIEPLLIPLEETTSPVPFTVADYVDFYASEHHAGNIGRIFRPDGEPLTPNWKHLPIGYHGRSGTVIPSTSVVVRPNGQRRDGEQIVFGPTQRLDIEAEVGFVVGVGSALGTAVPIDRFAEHVFGIVMLNDWSARDIQAWEYVPLGPFLGKSFATSISNWITPLAALEHARVSGPTRDPQPLPYLDDAGDSWALDLTLEVRLNGELISRPPFGTMYWTAAQMLAHLTVNGASIRTGDLFGSGTVSGPERDERGSLIELGWNGAEPLALADGTSRVFLADGDEVVVTATAPGPGSLRVGVAEVRGRISPAIT